MENALPTLLDAGNKLIHAPNWIVLIIFLNVIGWLLKLYKEFPNRLIPAVIVLLGSVLYPPLAGKVFGVADASGLSIPGVIIMRVMIGTTFGFFAWGLHGAFKATVKKFLPDFSDPSGEDKE